jgi:hypothetical protein
MNRSRLAAVLALAAATLAWSAATPGATAAALTGPELLRKILEFETGPAGWSDRRQRLLITIVGASGAERVRELDFFERKYDGNRRKGAVFFHAPASIQGTAFLQWTNFGADSAQWMYLPAVGRVRQISTEARNESFVGSDFSYGDLQIVTEFSTWTDAQVEASVEGDGEVGGVGCHRLVLKPKDEGLRYERIVVWPSKADYETMRMEFEDPARGVAKVLDLGEFRRVSGVSTPFRYVMRDVPSGTHTVVAVQDVAYNVGLEEGLFTSRALERGAP